MLLFHVGRKLPSGAYRQDLIHFAQFLGMPENDQGINQAASLLSSKNRHKANHLILNYKNYMVKRNEASNTMNGRLRTMRAIIKMARMIGTVSFTIEVENVKSKAYLDTRGPGLFGFRDMKQVAQSREDKKGSETWQY